ncbi:MAG: glycosyltransferase [Paludibacteraceae bacterium]|nr:glycosyltransferase [Paludibacteraceae bacterium]
MKKILHISKYYFPYHGGLEDIARSIVMEMREQYEQRVLCFNHTCKETIRSTEDGVEIVRIKAPFTISSQPISFSYLHVLRQEIRSFRPDIIHVHFPNPLVGLFLLLIPLDGIRLIIHWHSDILGKQVLYRLYRPLEQRILQRADAILVTSPQYKEYSAPLRDFIGKTQVLPNIIHEPKLLLQPEDKQAIEQIKLRFSEKKIVFFLGRHVPYKGVDILLQSVPYLSDTCVVVIGGTGEQTAYWQQLAAPYGDKVQFVGELHDDEKRRFLYASDVFAFPSIDRREAFGVALTEALYCGAPAVSFRIEGSGSMWVNQNGKTGIVVENIDPHAFAEAINTLVQDDVLRARYSKAAHQWIKKNFLKDQLYLLLTVYDNA